MAGFGQIVLGLDFHQGSINRFLSVGESKVELVRLGL